MDPSDVIADPLFCDPVNGEFTVDGASPCLPQNSNGCGLIGAHWQGCGVVSVDPSTWGQVKAQFRGEEQ